MNVLELFAGVGGLSLGLERAGFTTVGQVEINPFCRTILNKHWPEVPKHDDVRTAVAWWNSEPRPRVEVVAGGYPCQPESVAGKRLGTDDERWLWPEMARVIHALQPRAVICENVLGHRTKGLRFVLRDLERLGYTATPGIVRACEMGAPHPRPRLFILAHTDSAGLPQRPVQGSRSGNLRDLPGQRIAVGAGGPDRARFRDWPAEPDVGRVVDGLSSRLDRPVRVDRIRTLGNACVPAVGEYVGRLLYDFLDAGRAVNGNAA